MTKSQFIETFVANFLATHEANTYVEHCQEGWSADDAFLLAEKAWNEAWEYKRQSYRKYS